MVSQGGGRAVRWRGIPAQDAAGLFKAPANTPAWDVFADGSAQTPPFTIVQNWTSLLKK